MEEKINFMRMFYNTFVGETYPINVRTAEEWIEHIRKRNEYESPIPEDFTPFEFMNLWNNCVCPTDYED